LVHWPLMGWLLHLVGYNEEGPGRLVTVHPSTASVPLWWSVALRF